MNRNFPAYKDDEGFRRIAVLLLSLADLAEHAALRSLPVRWLMLWLLRPAEEAALGFAAQAGKVYTEVTGQTLPDRQAEVQAEITHVAWHHGERVTVVDRTDR